MKSSSSAGTCDNSLGVHFDRLENLDRFFRDAVKNGKHAFAACRVLRSGVEIFDRAYGVAAPGGPPLTTDAIYPVASVTKPFIAALMCILQEEGVVDFYERLQKYYPDFIGEGKEEVLLWHVMSHVSGMAGMGDEPTDKFVEDYIRQELGIELSMDPADAEQRLTAFMKVRDKLGLPQTEPDWDAAWEVHNILSLKAPLVRRTNSAFSYCSYGYELLKKLIEQVTGESIDAYARRKIFGPLGMDDTYWVLPKALWPRVVKRDPSFDGADWYNSDSMLTNTSGGGGLKSTMRDLTVFGQMILQEGTLGTARIMCPASVRLMSLDHNKKVPESYWEGRLMSSGWALGWNVKKMDDLGFLRSASAIDHPGSGGARLLIDPEYDLVASFYTVDQHAEPFSSHSRVANIMYSALD